MQLLKVKYRLKKTFLFLLYITGLTAFSQTPATINYQGLVRDAAGTPVTNTVVNLQFKISTSSNPNFFTETQSAVPVNSLGLFSTKIGASSPLPITGWQNTPVMLEVLADVNGSGFISMGSQQLSSVPYALYAHQAGNALPTGTVNGQTLRWDASTNKWEPTTNLTNDNQRVGIGVLPNALNTKLAAVTSNPFDSAAVTGLHTAGTNRAAGIRGVVFGNTTNSNPNNPYSTAIYGGQHIAYNTGTGFSVGNFGFGSSAGFGIGLAGYGSAQSATAVAVGIYASVDTANNTPNKYAAIFDKGAVLIGDSLLMNPSTNPGNIGDVLTKTGFNGRVKWAPAGGGPWGRTQIGGIFNTHLANPLDNVNIGLPSGIGANEKFHLHAQSGDAYMQISTSSTLNSVGLVFGESSNWSKGVLRFDNFSNTLLYQVLSKPMLMIDGTSKSTFVGRIPFGAASQSAFNVYDSILSTPQRPAIRVINTNTAFGSPTSILLSSGNTSGLNITYRKQTALNVLSIEDISLGNKHHTFNDLGEYSPGSDGTAGKSRISGGPGLNDNITVSAATNGNIVHSGFTQLGNNGTVFPAIQILEFTSTMPAGASSNTQINLNSYITSPSQIESVKILISTPNRIVPNNFTVMSGYECQYEISPTAPIIFIWTTSANSSLLYGQPFKLVVTIKK